MLLVVTAEPARHDGRESEQPQLPRVAGRAQERLGVSGFHEFSSPFGDLGAILREVSTVRAEEQGEFVEMSLVADSGFPARHVGRDSLPPLRELGDLLSSGFGLILKVALLLLGAACEKRDRGAF